MDTLRVLQIIQIFFFVLFACNSSSENTINQEQLKFTNLFNSASLKGQSCYRIPALITTSNGNIIAAIDERNNNCGDLRDNDDINIVIRTSEDNGQNWSEIKTIVDFPKGESASDPSMILDEITGEIFLFYNYMDLNKAPNKYFFQFISSLDQGKSWSTPTDITNQISNKNWEADFKFISSGRGIQNSSGTLLHTIVNLDKGVFVFGSRDHGQTWFLAKNPISPGDESKIVELNDGSYMINSRVNNLGMRYVHTSNDFLSTWNSKNDSTLIDPSCNASLIRYTSIQDGATKNRLLFSNPNSSEGRENLTLKISYDEGNSWKYSKTVYSGKSAYSSLSILQNGDIGIFFEKDNYEKSTFVRVDLSWLTNGKDSL